ncbi:MAG: hypothetical protein M3Z00_05680 [Actinomycetota bacterium]|nr:hypothetical protein [Actinomycetota bacterium]
MGEKGNGAAVGAAAIAAGSLIERVTTTATETVTGAGQDFLTAVKDKSIGAVADGSIAAARDRLHRKPDEESPADQGQGADGQEPT